MAISWKKAQVNEKSFWRSIYLSDNKNFYPKTNKKEDFLISTSGVLKNHNISVQAGEYGSKILIGDVCYETKNEEIETLVCDIFDNERRILSESYLNETITSLENLVKKNIHSIILNRKQIVRKSVILFVLHS